MGKIGKSVDHGLGGRNNEKSSDRRAKKSKASKKVISTANMSKKEVLFDESSRLDYLTGFRKRKTERRKFGLAMEVMKKDKAKREARKELRGLGASLNNDDTNANNNNNFNSNDNKDEDDDEEGKNSKTIKFDDENTSKMFQGMVSVEVDEGIAEEMDKYYSITSDDMAYNKKEHVNEPTRLEKAMKIVKDKNLMNKSRGRSQSSKNKHKLMSKAGVKMKFNRKRK